jgi:hypothetical protein
VTSQHPIQKRNEGEGNNDEESQDVRNNKMNDASREEENSEN